MWYAMTEPTISMSNGVFYDERIERLMAYTLKGLVHHDDYDTLLGEVMREFLHEDTPIYNASKAKPHECSILVFLAGIGFDFMVTNIGGPLWPGSFPQLPEAAYAVSIAYPGDPDDEECTYADYAPGTTLQLAALAALIQILREYAETEYNQGRLALHH